MKIDIFCGITLKWDYIKLTVQLRIPDYVQLSLEHFQHSRLNEKTDAPHEYKEPVYRLKRKYAHDPDTSPLLSQEKKTYSQQFVGVFLYYTWAVDLTILTAFNSIVGSQAAPTKKTLYHCTQLIYDISWHPQVDIEYKSNGMQLWLHVEAEYLVSEKAHSWIAG